MASAHHNNVYGKIIRGTIKIQNLRQRRWLEKGQNLDATTAEDLHPLLQRETQLNRQELPWHRI